MAHEKEILASQQYWLTGWGLTMPLVTGTLEVGHLAHVEGEYAGLTFATGAPNAGTYRPHIRIRRR